MHRFPKLFLLSSLLTAAACGAEDPAPPVAQESAPVTIVPGCDKTYTPLQVPGSQDKPGYAVMYNSETELALVLIAQGDWVPGSWVIDSASVYAGTAVPGTDPAAYPYQYTYGGVSATAIEVPLPGVCGSTINVSVFARLHRDTAAGREETTVWAGGTPWGGTPDPGWVFGTPNGDGWYAQTGVCCPAVTGCTYTQGYWKNHASTWPVRSLTIGGVTYSQRDLLAILATPPKGDASIILGRQLIAAMLNVASGASAAPPVASALSQAQSWMSTNRDADGRLRYSVHASTAAGFSAVTMSSLLDAYNQGNAGTPHCD